MLQPSGESPSARSSARAVYDSKRDRFVLFGGQTSDTWSLSLSGAPQWTELESGAALEFAPRSLHAAIYDSLRSRVLVYGGRLSYYEYHGGFRDEPFGDLWSLTFDPRPVWTAVPSEPRPTGRWGQP